MGEASLKALHQNGFKICDTVGARGSVGANHGLQVGHQLADGNIEKRIAKPSVRQ